VIVNTGRGHDIGSGIAIDEHHILTASHVVAAATGGRRPYYSDGSDETYWATVESRDEENDVAILRTDRTLTHYVPLADDDTPVTVAASSHGWFSGRRASRLEQQSQTAIFGAPARNGDSGGGIIAQYRGPVVTVGVISASDGRRTFGSPLRAIRKLFAKCRCGRRQPVPTTTGNPPSPPAILQATAESVPHTQEASVEWIPADRRLHFQIPRGARSFGECGPAGPQGPAGPAGQDVKRIASLEAEVAELRKRLDNFSDEFWIEGKPERRP
jgi:hypothetical protein